MKSIVLGFKFMVLFLFGSSLVAFSQTGAYPNHPIRLIVPLPPGLRHSRDGRIRLVSPHI